MLPTYDLVDAGVTYKMFIGKDKSDNITLRLSMNNVFDEVYFSELTSANPTTSTSTNYKGINVTNQGFFGFGRTWNFTVRYNF